ncbi:YceI family protein [Halomonas sediminis]
MTLFHSVLKRSPATLLAASIAFSAPSAQAAPETFAIDPEHFSVGFLAEHVGYAKILGMFLKAEGEFIYDEQSQTLHSAQVTIAADSVFTNHEERDKHLRSDDFLHSRRHPAIVFEATRFTAQSDNQGLLEGELTLLGETHPVTLDVTLNKATEYPFGHGEYTLGISARTTIERSRWDMRYALEEEMVADEIELIFEFEALRQ